MEQTVFRINAQSETKNRIFKFTKLAEWHIEY